MIKLKPIHEQTILQKYMDTVRAIGHHYTSIEPHLHQLNKSVRKQYLDALYNNKAFRGYYKYYLMENRLTFDNILSEYNMNTKQFLEGFE